MTATESLPTSTGRTILGYGFRPSFLTGAVWAGLAVLLSLPTVLGDPPIQTAYTSLDLQLHEAVFGYLAAILTGFLLTVVPERTGRPPQGRLLAVLILLWLAGRLAIIISARIGPILAGGIDSLFLLLAAAAAVREGTSDRKWTAIPPIGLLVVFLFGNVIFHFGYGELGERIGMAAAIMLVTLIGGRVIARPVPDGVPDTQSSAFAYGDLAIRAVTAAALVFWIVLPHFIVTAALMVVAGIMHGMRLVRWFRDQPGQNTWTLIQHLAYAFVPLGFLVLANRALFPEDHPITVGIRTWMVAAVGTMTLAMMARARLGETSRPILARPIATVIYGAVFIAIVTHLWSSFAPGWSSFLPPIGGIALVVAFAAFTIGYLPVLAYPRLDAR